MRNITLPTQDGSTQIDHIIISIYGIFVIETKHMKGWIFGSERQKTWTQKIYKKTYTFQNPLHQNYKHIKTLQSLLNLNNEEVFSVIVFSGESTFKTQLPDNVVKGSQYIDFIKSKDIAIFNTDDIKTIINTIKSGKLAASISTHKQHIKHAKSIVAKKN